MKRMISLILCLITLFTCCVFQTNAVDEGDYLPYVVDFSLTTPINETGDETSESRATGLITSYKLGIALNGTTLTIRAETSCIPDVVKCGFKNFVVERKKASSSTWSEYHDYGDLYNETFAASITTTLSVVSGYQYRVTCKHYAKKSLLVTQSVSNTSNIVAV